MGEACVYVYFTSLFIQINHMDVLIANNIYTSASFQSFMGIIESILILKREMQILYLFIVLQYAGVTIENNYVIA